MAELAFYSSIASLSLAASAFLSLSGLPEQLPLTAAGVASAAIFGGTFFVCRRQTRTASAARAHAPLKASGELRRAS